MKATQAATRVTGAAWTRARVNVDVDVRERIPADPDPIVPHVDKPLSPMVVMMSVLARLNADVGVRQGEGEGESLNKGVAPGLCQSV